MLPVLRIRHITLDQGKHCQCILFLQHRIVLYHFQDFFCDAFWCWYEHGFITLFHYFSVLFLSINKCFYIKTMLTWKGMNNICCCKAFIHALSNNFEKNLCAASKQLLALFIGLTAFVPSSHQCDRETNKLTKCKNAHDAFCVRYY